MHILVKSKLENIFALPKNTDIFSWITKKERKQSNVFGRKKCRLLYKMSN